MTASASTDTTIESGTGLSNVVRRLELLFPGAHTFALAARATEGNRGHLELSGRALSHTVIIVDDEPPARAKLMRFLAPLPEFQVVAQADTVESAVAEIIAAKPDFIYLDIQLGAGSGFEVIEAIRGTIPACGVHHRLLGIRRSRLRRAGARLLAQALRSRAISAQRPARQAKRSSIPTAAIWRNACAACWRTMPGQRSRPIKQILVRDRARAFFIPVDSIDRLSAAGNYVEIHAGGKVHLVREPLAKISRAIGRRGIHSRASLARGAALLHRRAASHVQRRL